MNSLTFDLIGTIILIILLLLFTSPAWYIPLGILSVITFIAKHS